MFEQSQLDATVCQSLLLTLETNIEKSWRAREDSNLRPPAPQADALSTELRAREPKIIPELGGFGLCYAAFEPLPPAIARLTSSSNGSGRAK